ncbi:MAG TPA: MBL fold metallo-hydrolase [Flavobacteriales bacterium]|nr:MBL fold metallo-hydrolase [Flavobacteriales bacterium]HPH82226.1 MBL fold metallo-hydrolase [Flavobacteriales bacterium]
MQLFPINTGHFKLDGGAMFGVVPKSLWSKSYPADANNLCSWAMRCLLVQEGNRLVLIDNGMGNKQDEKFFSHYDLHGDDSLDASLKKAGFHRDDITDVFLTHLHFDHCGGSIEWDDARSGYRPAFKNAVYWSNQEHWKWATEPNPRERASFLKENILPIQESGQLKFLESNELFPGFSVEKVSGHTESMMLPVLSSNGHKIMYMADLLPSPVHVPVAWVMAYDTRPLLTMQEKSSVLATCVSENRVLFFEHDKSIECATLQQTEKGIRVLDTFPLSALF